MERRGLAPMLLVLTQKLPRREGMLRPAQDWITAAASPQPYEAEPGPWMGPGSRVPKGYGRTEGLCSSPSHCGMAWADVEQMKV